MPWQRTYEMALAAQSPLWGGDANLVLPATNDIHDNELFWTLAERLDADYFVSAAFTHRDVGEADPQWLAEWKAGLEAAVDRDIPDASHEARAGLIERELDEVALEARPDDAFADLLERRLAPFHRRRVARFPRLLAVNERRPRAVISHEFANVLQIRRSITQVNNPHTSLGSLEQLLLTAQLGRLASGFEAALTQSTNIIVTPSEVNDRHEWASLIFDPRLAGATAVPRTLNHLGLGWYRHGPGERERVILVTGETPWDFTLYYALLRWRGSAVYWLPQGLTDDGAYTSALGMALRDAGRRAGDDTVTVVTSSDEDFRDQAVAALAEGTLSMFGVPASAADWRAVCPRSRAPARRRASRARGARRRARRGDGRAAHAHSSGGGGGPEPAAVGDRRPRPRLGARPPREPRRGRPPTAHVRQRLRARGPQRGGVHLDRRDHPRRREPRHEHGAADTAPDSAARSAERRAGRRRLVLPGVGQGRLRGAIGAAVRRVSLDGERALGRARS